MPTIEGNGPWMFSYADPNPKPKPEPVKPSVTLGVKIIDGESVEFWIQDQPVQPFAEFTASNGVLVGVLYAPQWSPKWSRLWCRGRTVELDANKMTATQSDFFGKIVPAVAEFNRHHGSDAPAVIDPYPHYYENTIDGYWVFESPGVPAKLVYGDGKAPCGNRSPSESVIATPTRRRLTEAEAKARITPQDPYQHYYESIGYALGRVATSGAHPEWLDNGKWSTCICLILQSPRWL